MLTASIRERSPRLRRSTHGADAFGTMDAGVRVLVVGDGETIAPGLSRHVNGRFDLSVVGSAAAVEAAIRLCTTNPIDVVLVDLDSLRRAGGGPRPRAERAPSDPYSVAGAGARARTPHRARDGHPPRARGGSRNRGDRRGAWDQPAHGPEPREAHPGQARRSLEGGGRHAGLARRARTDPARPSWRGSSGAPGRLRGRLRTSMGQGSRTSPDLRSSPFRVVIIDDDIVLRRVVSIACAATAGVGVGGEAQDGEEGLDLCERLAPDLVVLDLTLPGVGGLEVATRLRESRSTSRILIFTAREDGETVLAAMRSGVHGFLAKSAAIDDVASAMLAVARGESIFPPEHERAAVQELGRLARAARSGSPTLTLRQITILQLLADGLSLRQGGTRLGISHRTFG